MTTRVWALMPLAVAVNVLTGNLAAILRLPIYLDSVGTVLMGALCGPAAGALTGLASQAVIAITTPTFFPFVGTSVAIGWLSGWLTQRKFFLSPSAAASAGLFVGVISALLSAPVSAYVFGGVTGGGTDVLVALFRASGGSKLEASLGQGLVSDPFDKMMTFLLVQMVLARLPRSIRQSFPQGPNLTGLARRRQSMATKAAPGERVDRVATSSGPTASYGWLHQVSFETKLLGLLNVVAAAGLWPAADSSSAGLVVHYHLPLLGALLFVLALSGRVGVGAAQLMTLGWGPLALSMSLINGVFGPQPRVETSWGLAYSPEGLVDGLGLALRLMVLLLGAFLLFQTSTTEAMAQGLERLGLPPKPAYVLLAAVNLLPTMSRRLDQIQDAQRARGLYLGGSVLGRLKALLPLLGPVFLAALAENEMRAMALEARGFGAQRWRTSLEAHVRGREWFPRLTLVGLFVWLLWIR